MTTPAAWKTAAQSPRTSVRNRTADPGACPGQGSALRMTNEQRYVRMGWRPSRRCVICRVCLGRNFDFGQLWSRSEVHAVRTTGHRRNPRQARRSVPAVAEESAPVERGACTEAPAPTTSALMPTQFSIGVDLHRHTCGPVHFLLYLLERSPLYRKGVPSSPPASTATPALGFFCAFSVLVKNGSRQPEGPTGRTRKDGRGNDLGRLRLGPEPVASHGAQER